MQSTSVHCKRPSPHCQRRSVHCQRAVGHGNGLLNKFLSHWRNAIEPPRIAIEPPCIAKRPPCIAKRPPALAKGPPYTANGRLDMATDSPKNVLRLWRNAIDLRALPKVLRTLQPGCWTLHRASKQMFWLRRKWQGAVSSPRPRDQSALLCTRGRLRTARPGVFRHCLPHKAAGRWQGNLGQGDFRNLSIFLPPIFCLP